MPLLPTTTSWLPVQVIACNATPLDGFCRLAHVVWACENVARYRENAVAARCRLEIEKETICLPFLQFQNLDIYEAVAKTIISLTNRLIGIELNYRGNRFSIKLTLEKPGVAEAVRLFGHCPQ